MNPITAFQGEYRFLSNFWPCYLEYEGLVYPSTEHAYQAAKFGDPEIKMAIRDCPTPAEAKDWAGLNNKKPHPEWTADMKLRLMETLLWIKFGGRNPLLTRALLATGDAEIVEGNTWNDTFWGVCNNDGENQLGKLLMKIRAELVLQKEKILQQLRMQMNNEAIAVSLGISKRTLYEKMIAFSIPNQEFWIS